MHNKLINNINRALKLALNENNINLLADLDNNSDSNIVVNTKNVNSKIKATKYREEMKNILSVLADTDTQIYIDILNNKANYNKYKNLIKAENREHLDKLLSAGIKLVGYNGNFNWIDVSDITDFSFLFSDYFQFNGDISLWNVSNAETFENMFEGCNRFNCDISQWDVSNCKNFAFMFYGNKSFNQPIGNWNMANATSLDMMFGDSNFNSPLNDWDVSNVISMTGTFYDAAKFNKPLYKWDVSNVITMDLMFNGAKSFNQNINDWKRNTIDDSEIIFTDDCPIKEEYKPSFCKN